MKQWENLFGMDQTILESNIFVAKTLDGQRIVIKDNYGAMPNCIRVNAEPDRQGGSERQIQMTGRRAVREAGSLLRPQKESLKQEEKYNKRDRIKAASLLISETLPKEVSKSRSDNVKNNACIVGCAGYSSQASEDGKCRQYWNITWNYLGAHMGVYYLYSTVIIITVG